jgi:hypothetical protein
MKPGLLVGCLILAASGRTLAQTRDAAPDFDNLPANVWVEFRPEYKPLSHGGEHHPVSWNKLVYDSVGKRIINIDRWTDSRHADGVYIYANSLMALDPDANQVELLSTFEWRKEKLPNGAYRTLPLPENEQTPTPCPRHPYGNVAFVSLENAVYLSGGANQTSRQHYQRLGQTWPHPNDTWRFAFDSGKWEQIEGLQPPPSLSDSMTWVPDRKAIIRWVAEAGEAWIFRLDDHRWSKLETIGQPTLVRRTAMTYDTVRKQVLLYGGQVQGGKLNQQGEQLWSLSIDDMTWRRLPDGPPVTGAGWTYAPRYDVALAHRNLSREDRPGERDWDTGEFWLYFPGEKEWVLFESEKPVPNKLYQTLVYDEGRDLFFCHTRPLKWYAMRLDPARLRGLPETYLKRKSPL